MRENEERKNYTETHIYKDEKKLKFFNTFMNSKTTAAFYHSIYEIF